MEEAAMAAEKQAAVDLGTQTEDSLETKHEKRN
jgi:hypothetical protein